MPSYSLNKELRWGTKEHRMVLEALRARLSASEQKMDEYDEKFDRAEEQQTAFIPETAVDTKKRQDWEERGIMNQRTVVVPIDYSTVLSAHTYWTSVFLGRNPILEFMGQHGSAEHQTQAVNAVMDYQLRVGKWKPNLFAWLFDGASYPFGVIGNFWAEEYHNVATIEEQPETMFELPVEGKTKKVKVTKRKRGYAGNKIFNIRPQDFRPDHRVPVWRCQEGEYCGRYYPLGWNNLLKGKEQEIYYNLDEVKKYRARMRRRQEESTTPDKELPGGDHESVETADIPDVGTLDADEIYVELIPKDWKLGSSTSPEIWRFTVVDDHCIVESRPCGNWHGKFPYFVLPYDFDAHSFLGRALYNVVEPMNNVLSWLINAHMYNVRAMLNNKLVVDPSRVVMKDLLSGDQRAIRLKPTAYGSDPRLAVSQLQVGDVTQNHLRDAQTWMEMIQRATGVSDNIMGMVNPGGRKTATEVRSSSTMGINRLKTVAEWWSAVGMEPLAQMALQNTQQYMDEGIAARVVGDIPPDGMQTIAVSPDDIIGQFDFIPVDGTLPVDRYAQANLWREMLTGMRQMPEIAQQYDMGGIFAWVAQLAGLKNIKQFRVQQMPMEGIQNEVGRGNLVPVPGGGGRSTGNRRAERDLGRVPEPGQVPGMGSTG